MIQSMTGYGKATTEHNGKKITVEIRTLNSKSLDLSMRVSHLYREKEMEIRTEIGKRLERGKVDFSLWIDSEQSTLNSPINPQVVEAYYKQIEDISNTLGIPMPTNWFEILLRLPDVTSKVATEVLDETEWLAVNQTISDALDQLIDFRAQEGASLAGLLTQKIACISSLMEAVTPFENERVDRVRAKITEALEKNAGEYDPNRLEQELIYYIEKLDINEEKQRLANHLTYFITTLNEPAGQGKKLGFINQEIGREVNTMGSKSNHAEMQQLVVQMKDELEQIKEQVLNVM